MGNIARRRGFMIGGAFKTQQEWEDIAAIVEALQNGQTPPAMRSVFKEWKELGEALANLTPGAGSGFTVIFQDTDPGTAAGAGGLWVNFANERIGLRDSTNTSWTFFTADGGVGTIGMSGYGIGGYGELPWDTTLVNSSVLTTTPSLGLYKPLYATVGWGRWLSANIDKMEAFNVRLLAAEAAAALLP